MEENNKREANSQHNTKNNHPTQSHNDVSSDFAIKRKKLSRHANPYERLEGVVSYVLVYQYLHNIRTADEVDISAYQEILNDYTNQNKDLLRLIIMKVEPYVRSYPQIAFRKSDEDIRSAFFVYIYERFEGILAKFDHRLGSFATYLSLKLKNYFLNYIRREKMMNKVKTINYDVDSHSEGIFRNHGNLELQVAEKELLVDEKHKENDLFVSLQNDPFRYLCIKLYFFDLFTKGDFELLIDHLKIEENAIPTIKEEVSKLSGELHRKKLVKIYYENCLNRTYYQNMLRAETVEDMQLKGQPKRDIDEVLDKQRRISLRRNTLLLKYHSTNIFPSMKQIARVMCSDSAKVSNIINYYKHHLNRNHSNPM